MAGSEPIPIADLTAKDHVVSVGKDYIPTIERKLRATIMNIFRDPSGQQGNEISNHELLSEAVFWSLGELINNANKANNRWALLRNALMQRIVAENKLQNDQAAQDKVQTEVDYAIEHNQTDLLKKYNLTNVDLTSSILKLIEMHKTNSFALSERFNKKIDVTLRVKAKSGHQTLFVNVINNSPITVIDKQRVEYNLEKIKEDLMMAGKNSRDASVRLYDKQEDHAGGGFGAGLRSIILFLKEGYAPFTAEIKYSTLIQYRSAGNSTIFSVELPIP
ncbi:MAG TPA: hypothetical protein PKE49_07340 [Leptospiraceae bacterium]|jgi:hypothetical protein|nr:hypothetical protein [Leptospirales bacterium]HMW60456.1 hypothetical protein [Leptospiraceae bacterium]HMX56321.1 hypothetical protein [Leptospiraceae bacterium]HMY47699.1 hypothetical protein [Leptospiraceae bacterium]HMZ37146.1 hypothetical protein [Leptospiraceae bacterium]